MEVRFLNQSLGRGDLGKWAQRRARAILREKGG